MLRISELSTLEEALTSRWNEIQSDRSVFITRSLTAAVSKWGRLHRFEVAHEALIDTPGYVSAKGITRTKGYLDLLLVRGSLRVAIEIDRGNKAFSLAKLERAVHSRGAEAIWIKWGAPVKVRIPPRVHLIKLSYSEVSRPDR